MDFVTQCPVLSIPLNIAEGSSKYRTKDFSSFWKWRLAFLMSLKRQLLLLEIWNILILN
ncbi:MAG TPA: hypothetical protein DEP71_08495 [Porphyromonadaceae bacterium]|nr:hypothetical protein [Bacteroidales bacterium]HBQ56787.1 hypothetical protein [Porphyromonadaceae bacterium]HCB00025.1 hypothetical protein [Porphyromonadaceae bacterium]HCB89303.1 hypothetical protein [Porphyromonadaceae bacterium]